jgi:hypothetical protein
MCADYERCLDEAIRRRWRGFSCRKCRAFRPLHLDPDDWLLDYLACIALIHTAEFQSGLKHMPRWSIILKLRHIRSEVASQDWI